MGLLIAIDIAPFVITEGWSSFSLNYSKRMGQFKVEFY